MTLFQIFAYKNIHICRWTKQQPREGGIARDIAYIAFLNSKYYLVHLGKFKALNYFKVLIVLLLLRNRKIFIHFPFSGIPLSDKFFFLKLFRIIFLKIIYYSSHYNELVFDIADLPYEQALDLDLPIPFYYQEIESKIFNLPAKYIFASYSMRIFAVNKFHLPIHKTSVCINGGPVLSENKLNMKNYLINKDKVNFVYAGTLNKGRGIMQVIEIFKNAPDVTLTLLGEMGDWINNINLPDNICYLGAIDERIAHSLVSLFDVGLIPYDSQKLYYNIAYPTKLSFYITAGITFLSSDVSEVKIINEKYNMGFVFPIEDWNRIIFKITKNHIFNQKRIVLKYKKEFYWNAIFDNESLLLPI
jgi:hypothetical protein